MDRAARQKLAKVAPEAVLLCQLPRLEPGLAREEPLVMAKLVVVELIEEDQRRAAEFLWHRPKDGADGICCRCRLQPEQVSGNLVERRPERGRQENPRIALPVGRGKALDVNRKQPRMTLEGRHETGLK
jgi:hypothetical protein